MGKWVDETGNVYGRLTVIERAGSNIHKKRLYRCLCSCGNTTVVVGSRLRSGLTRSCGCLHKEQLAERSRSHGLSDSRIYRKWSQMMSRCEYNGEDGQERYKSKGIRVCPDWLIFENFYRDMGCGFKEGLYLDRIDGTSGYCKENCRWVTAQQNAWNSLPHKNKKGSRYKGVYENYGSGYYVKMSKDGEIYDLGKFDNEIDAAIAYNKKAVELYGEYAYLNPVEQP